MTDQNGFGTGTPAGLVWQNDNGAYTLGQRFRVSAAGLSAVNVRWFIPTGSPAAPTSGYRVAIYEVGNTTAVATSGTVSATVGAWNEQAVTAVPLTLGGDYIAAVLYPGGYYGAQAGLMPTDPAGDLNFYDGGVFNSGSSLTYPGTSAGTPWYGIDVTVSDGVASGQDITGTAASSATTAAGSIAAANPLSGAAASAATTAAGTLGTPQSMSGTAASGATTAHGTITGPVGGFARDRAALVELLAAVPGIVALPYPAGVPAQGQAWPLLGPIDLSRWPVATWRVVCVAGGDGQTAERWLDANLTALLEALRPFMYVDSVTPVDLGNTYVGVQFAGRKEVR